jgi:predicted NUDIX family NTP pyrophosphohydrolase
MPKRSAGLMLFRRIAGRIEVLLVHPGGPFFARKDKGAWSIPKGEYEAGEEPRVAALREFEEETGHRPDGEPLFLGEIRQAGGKIVTAFALEGDLDPERIESNLFEIEWPPRSGRLASFPEIDRAAWFGVEEARTKILASQVPLLDRLTEAVADFGSGGT